MATHCVEWDGDWSKRPPALLENTTLILFPLLADRTALENLCKERFDGPSENRVQVEPLGDVNGKSLVLLVAADLPRIKSKDPDQEANEGYLAEHDVGIFVPVKYRVDGADAGIAVIIPYLYVDNPAAVIMGREIHGFPKILAGIDFNPTLFEFDVRTLVFPQTGPDVLAEEREIIRVRRGPWFPFSLPLLDWLAGWLANVQPASSDLGLVAQAVLQAVGLSGMVNTNDFTEVTFLFLKQFRAVAGHPGVDFQRVAAVPGTVASLPTSVQVDVWPLFWPVKITFTEFSRSVNIPSTLGLPSTMDVFTTFRINLNLEIKDGRLL
jgi:hypothetical protein